MHTRGKNDTHYHNHSNAAPGDYNHIIVYIVDSDVELVAPSIFLTNDLKRPLKLTNKPWHPFREILYLSLYFDSFCCPLS